MPVIYHDFVVSMATKSKTDILASDVERIKIPLKDFSFYQLQTLKVKIFITLLNYLLLKNITGFLSKVVFNFKEKKKIIYFID